MGTDYKSVPTKSRMRSKILFVTVFSLVVFSGFAQKTANVSGKLMSEGIPVEFANVILTTSRDTSAILNHEISDSTGMFRFDNVPFGEYRLTCRMIGFKTTTTSFTLNENNPSTDLGILTMEPDITLLGEVTVTAQRKLIQKTTEGFILNASADITLIGGTATDLLRNTPTVNVDSEGGITLRGKTPLILINGRHSAMSNTDHIAASSVECIEIINNPFVGDATYGRTHNYEYAYVHNAVLNYVFPVTPTSIVETGYKGILRILDDDYETSDKIGNDYIVDTKVSNLYKFNEQIHAAYLKESTTPVWGNSGRLSTSPTH